VHLGVVVRFVLSKNATQDFAATATVAQRAYSVLDESLVECYTIRYMIHGTFKKASFLTRMWEVCLMLNSTCFSISEYPSNRSQVGNNRTVDFRI